MMIFTNPNNPTGTVYSEEEMGIVLAFCRRHNIHLVSIYMNDNDNDNIQFSDEIYALSVKPEDQMKEGENKFVSFAKFIENDPKKDDVTCVCSFIRDLT